MRGSTQFYGSAPRAVFCLQTDSAKLSCIYPRSDSQPAEKPRCHRRWILLPGAHCDMGIRLRLIYITLNEVWTLPSTKGALAPLIGHHRHPQ